VERKSEKFLGTSE